MRWLFQFYDTWKSRDNDFNLDYSLRLNPMEFPIWPDSVAPDAPLPCTMQLIWGFREATTERLSAFPPASATEYANFPEKHLMLEDRVRDELKPAVYNRKVGEPWFGHTNPSCRLLIKTAGKLPTFMVTSMDGNSWKGNFRFGGIEIQRKCTYSVAT